MFNFYIYNIELNFIISNLFKKNFIKKSPKLFLSSGDSLYRLIIIITLYNLQSPEKHIGSQGPKPKSSEPKIKLICNDKFFIISRVFYIYIVI